MRSTLPLHDRIRGLAAERNFTQDAVGKVLGLTRPAVRRRYKGETEYSASELQKLAVAFELPVGALFGETLVEQGDER